MSRGPRARRAFATTLAAAIAAAVCAVTVSGSVKVTPNPAGTNGIGTIGQPMRIVASIRNTGGTTEMLSLQRSATAAPACPASVTAAPLAGSFPRAVEPGAQLQVVIATPGFTATEVMMAAGGAITCNFDVVESPASGPTVQLAATFAVSTMGTPFDPQAKSLDFVPAATGPEVQTVLVQNYTTGALPDVVATIAGDPDDRVTFAGGSAGCGGHTCALPAIAAASAFEVPVQCATGSGSATESASIGWGSSATQLVACNAAPAMAMGEQIALATGDLVIVSQPGVTGSASTAVTSAPLGNDTLAAVELTGGDASLFSLPGLANCQTPQSCDLSGAPLALPHDLVVACTPDSTGVRATMLTITGASGTQANALVECDGNGAAMGPVLQLSTTTLAVPGEIPVGATSAPVPLVITNAGSGTLTAHLTIEPPADQEWAASACAAAPCSLVGHGSAATVLLTLTPKQHGDRGGAMTLAANDPDQLSRDIGLAGTGLGGVIQVLAPESAATTGTLQFGTIPASQSSSITVQLLDRGNAPLTVAIAPPAAPFAALPGSIDIAANSGTNTFVARCGPALPSTMLPFAGSGDFLLTSAAYNTPSLPLHASCTIVDAAVTANPVRFDFGELRVGGDAVAKPFAIANATSMDVTITDLAIGPGVPPPSVLSLAVDGTGAPDAPHVLHAGEMLTGTVTLTPVADTATSPIPDDTALGFAADGTALALPITGKVVTPHAKIMPPELALGTACVGSVVSATVSLENDGTATLAMDSPTIDEAFIAHYLVPTTYPSPLVPGGEARLEIVPASTAIGTAHGTLTWPVDVSSGAFIVPIDLDYIDAGTAVSPRALDFDAHPAMTASERATVTIENCNPDPIAVAVGGIVADAGAAEAWDLQPKRETRELLPHATMKLLVRFVPPSPGEFHAHIAIATGDVETDVALSGLGTGPPPGKTSFYACSCAAPGGPPTGAWPIALVLLAIATRARTRGSRRPRLVRRAGPGATSRTGPGR